MSRSRTFTLSAARALIHRVPPLRRLARSLHEGFVAERQFEVDLPELTPVTARVDPAGAPVRLNLLLPGASARHVFGGAATALALFDAVWRGEPRRILVTDERELEALDPKRFAGWRIASLDEAHPDDMPTLVPMADRLGRSLPVHAGDRFLATAWWTAHHARSLTQWQARNFGTAQAHPFAYLIQDYEPGFYPWSARSALADQTYGWGDEMIAVFNTAGLRHYVAGRHPSPRRAFDFEPVLHPELSARVPHGTPPRRQPQLLIYGRPGVPRNAFALIVQGLRAWVAGDPAAAGWRCLSLGEAHPELSLGTPPGAHEPLKLESLGKVSLADYARLMSESAIGVGLMISPHPSYPPLEMAAFGMRVITNRFEGKALSQTYPNIHDLDPPSPEAMAAVLAQWTQAHARVAPTEWSQPAVASPLLRSADPFAFVEDLRRAWLPG